MDTRKPTLTHTRACERAPSDTFGAHTRTHYSHPIHYAQPPPALHSQAEKGYSNTAQQVVAGGVGWRWVISLRVPSRARRVMASESAHRWHLADRASVLAPPPHLHIPKSTPPKHSINYLCNRDSKIADSLATPAWTPLPTPKTLVEMKAQRGG